MLFWGRSRLAGLLFFIGLYFGGKGQLDIEHGMTVFPLPCLQIVNEENLIWPPHCSGNSGIVFLWGFYCFAFYKIFVNISKLAGQVRDLTTRIGTGISITKLLSVVKGVIAPTLRAFFSPWLLSKSLKLSSKSWRSHCLRCCGCSKCTPVAKCLDFDHVSRGGVDGHKYEDQFSTSNGH